MSTAHDIEPPVEEGGGGVSQRSVELAVAVLLVVFTVAVIWDNLRIGAGWSESGPQAGYFPMRIGILVGVCALAIGWQAIRSRSTAVFATWAHLKRVAQVLVPLTIYVIAIGLIGIYVASTLFIGLFMAVAGRYPWWKSALVGVLTSVVMFYVFELQFKVPLPKGPLEALFGY